MKNKFIRLAALRQQLAALEVEAAREKKRMIPKLRALPGKFGCSDMVEFIALLGETLGIGPAVAGIAQPPARNGAPKAKRHRTAITPALAKKLDAMIADKKGATEISKALGISKSTVHRRKR